MKRDISKKRLLSHPIEDVWECLTHPDKLKWLGDVHIELEEGGKLSLTDRDKAISGEILTVQKPINLAYSWVDPSQSFTTYVWWKLIDKKGKTFLELEHSGFKGIKGILASYSYAGFWSKKFKKLDAFMAQTEAVEG